MEAIQLVPREGVQHRIAEQIVFFLAPHTDHEGNRRGRSACACKSETWKQSVDIPVPPIIEHIVVVIQLVPQMCIQERIVEQIIDFPVPRITEEIVVVVLLVTMGGTISLRVQTFAI